MARQVLIAAADPHYSAHVRSLLVNCRIQGGWTGDVVVIVPEDELALCPHLADLQGRGIEVCEVPDSGFMLKFWMFSDRFRRYERALWLDCDVLVQRPLEALSSLEFPEAALLSTESATIRDTFWRDEKAIEHADVYQWIARNFIHFGQTTYNTSCVLFKPSAFPLDTVRKLRALQDKIKLVNDPGGGGTDQQPINLLLYNQFGRIPNDLAVYWAFPTPDTVVVHYCRWYAPWLEKQPGAHAYYNDVLNAPCKHIYDTNLAKFNEVFPKC